MSTKVENSTKVKHDAKLPVQATPSVSVLTHQK